MPVRLELPVPFPLRTVNAWLFAGSQPAMVDCGIGTPENRQQIHDGLREAGISVDGLTIYLTHGHVDHAGNAAHLHGQGATLAAPPEEAPFVSTFRADEEQRNDEFAAALLAHGMPQDVVTRIRAQSDAIDSYLEDCPIGHPLAEEEKVVLGDADATAIRTPGHTPGSTCYILDNTILTGDTLLETITSNAVELRDEDQGSFHQYVQTVDGMRKYVDMEALPGHRDPFMITDALLDQHMLWHDQRRQRILGLLHRPKTAWQLFPDVFPGLDRDPHYFMGMSEIVGHLHSLEQDGKIKRSSRDNQRRFEAT